MSTEKKIYISTDYTGEAIAPHQYFVTDANGKGKWEEKLAYSQSEVLNVLPETDVTISTDMPIADFQVELNSIPQSNVTNAVIIFNNSEYPADAICDEWNIHIEVPYLIVCDLSWTGDGLVYGARLMIYEPNLIAETNKLKVDYINTTVKKIDKIYLYEELNSNLINGSAEGSLQGINATANGAYSFAEGKATANGSVAHAEGSGFAIGAKSHAEGSQSIAIGTSSHSEGESVATGICSHAEGDGLTETVKLNPVKDSLTATVPSGSSIKVMPGDYIIDENGQVVEVTEVNDDRTITFVSPITTKSYTFLYTFYRPNAKGIASHSEGKASRAFGDYCHAEGLGTEAYGKGSHSEGGNTIAYGYDSHAEGSHTVALGHYSHAEGSGYSTSLLLTGDANAVIYTYSNTEFPKTGNVLTWGNQVVEITSVDEESKTITVSSTLSSKKAFNKTYVGMIIGSANGLGSHVEGRCTTAIADYSHVQGRYNIADPDERYAHIVGNGDNTTPSNAHTIDWNGNAWYQGSVYVGGTNQDEGSEKLLTQSEVNSIINELLAAILPTPTVEDAGKVLRVNEEGKYELVAPLTNEEIDDICGSTVQVSSEMVDEATGESYRLYVSNGELKMEKVV